ncbi:hypothetical protein AGLY_006189 [Aphis glycines]|uniref:Uncharacterized protein n=1 Tax=Aphis glycines TaxID=307491 RepID=A0A6G0TTG9_APHGL|nr:hypothetical protein AGLY_006189 [Aphis glycines]
MSSKKCEIDNEKRTLTHHEGMIIYYYYQKKTLMLRLFKQYCVMKNKLVMQKRLYMLHGRRKLQLQQNVMIKAVTSQQLNLLASNIIFNENVKSKKSLGNGEFVHNFELPIPVSVLPVIHNYLSIGKFIRFIIFLLKIYIRKPMGTTKKVLNEKSQFSLCTEKFITLSDVPGEDICLRRASESQALNNGQRFFKCTYQQKVMDGYISSKHLTVQARGKYSSFFNRFNKIIHSYIISLKISYTVNVLAISHSCIHFNHSLSKNVSCLNLDLGTRVLEKKPKCLKVISKKQMVLIKKNISLYSFWVIDSARYLSHHLFLTFFNEAIGKLNVHETLKITRSCKDSNKIHYYVFRVSRNNKLTKNVAYIKQYTIYRVYILKFSRKSLYVALRTSCTHYKIVLYVQFSMFSGSRRSIPIRSASTTVSGNLMFLLSGRVMVIAAATSAVAPNTNIVTNVVCGANMDPIRPIIEHTDNRVARILVGNISTVSM